MKIKFEEKELIIKYKKKNILKEIYDKIFEDTMGMNLNEIHIKYKIKKEENRIRIFGDNFVYYNKNNCIIIFNGKIYNLISHLDIKNRNRKKNIIEIKLRGIKNIKFANGLFYGCSSLKSLLDISKWNIYKITDIRGLFYDCSSLKE